MTKAQFKRLTDMFWKTASAEQLQASYENFRTALRNVPEASLDRAIVRAFEECEKMPFPKSLREWAASSTPKVERRAKWADGCSRCGGLPRVTFREIEDGIEDGDGERFRYQLSHKEHCDLYDASVQWSEAETTTVDTTPAIPATKWREKFGAPPTALHTQNTTA